MSFLDFSNSHLPRPNPVGPNHDGPVLPVANQLLNGPNGQPQQVYFCSSAGCFSILVKMKEKTWFVQNDSTKAGDFHYYSDSEDEESDTVRESGDRISCNFVDYTNARSLGLGGSGGSRFFGNHLSSEYATRHMLTNGMFKESVIYR